MRLLIVVLIMYSCLFSREAFTNQTLKGSPASLQKQNQEADRIGLARIADDSELQLFKENGLLISIPKTTGIKIDPRLDERFHVVRPWTAKFLSDIGKSFKKRFKANLQVNSATRTLVHQENLAKRNKNAAPVTGETRSAHLTGAAIDLAKKPLTRKQKQWLRAELSELEKSGFIEATEEHYQAVFHVMVFDNYDPPKIKVVLK
ncbi:MAG: hypothetical protein KBC62_00645 [Candidatus Pacebacteria bacterium]|jgi:hypothetical protein|nr:hypothetical protein [Candidatus Paceibacterota bacterium]